MIQSCLQVYSNASGEHRGAGMARRRWESQPFTLPATFDTIALDSKIKQAVLAKLDSFVGDAAFFRQTGRPHKFGAFLFGPPGMALTRV